MIINQIKALQKWAADAKMEALPEYHALLRRLLDNLEQLPVVDYGIRHPRGFILIGNEWHAVHVLNILKNGWAEWRLDHEDGCSEGGPVQPYHWADVTADNTPSIVVDDATLEMLTS